MNDNPASLDRLHGLAPPEPVPFWPPQAGWWILGLLLLVTVGALAWRQWRTHRSNAYRRAALAELDTITATGDLAALLKRTALAAWPRGEVASLGGDSWISWLGETAGHPVPPGVQHDLLDAPYLNPSAEAAPELRQFVETWINRHKR